MKQIDEKAHVRARSDKEYWQSCVVQLCEIQIKGLVRLLETNQDQVESALEYNYVAGLINQLKAHIPMIFWPRNLDEPKQEGVMVQEINTDSWAPYRTWDSSKQSD